MVVYFKRRVVVRTQDGDLKEVVRNVREKKGAAIARYQSQVQRVYCAGNALDKNALWLVR